MCTSARATNGHPCLLLSRQKEAARREEEAKGRAEEAAKQEQRKKTYEEAVRREVERVAAILEKQREKDRALAELNQKRGHEADLRSLQHQLDLENKRDKVTTSPSQGIKRVSLPVSGHNRRDDSRGG